MNSTMQKAFLSGGETAKLAAVGNGAKVTMKSAAVRRVKRAPPKQKGDLGVWYPGAKRPPWLDGKMVGDRGYDPLGLAKPAEYLQVDLDQQDQNAPKNVKGKVLGAYKLSRDKVSENRLAPYSEVFGIQRFRETELIHGRWAMLAVAGIVLGEAVSGVPWHKSGKVILDSGAQYFNLNLPFTVTQLVIIEVLLVGVAEVYRNTELNPEKRCYPGGYFDPLGFTKGKATADTVFSLQTAEIKHCRLAMVAFLGMSVQALLTDEGALGSIARYVRVTSQ